MAIRYVFNPLTSQLDSVNADTSSAGSTSTSVTNFNSILSATDTSVQLALDTIDNVAAKKAASSTDNAIARFDGTTGQLIQNSSATISDGGILTSSGGFYSVSTYGQITAIPTPNASWTAGVMAWQTGVNATNDNIGIYTTWGVPAGYAFSFCQGNTSIMNSSSTGAWTFGADSGTQNHTVNGLSVKLNAPVGGYNNSLKWETAGTGAASIAYKHTIGGWDFFQDALLVANCTQAGAWTFGAATNTASNHEFLAASTGAVLKVTGSGTGGAYIRIVEDGTQEWFMGMDNSSSIFKLRPTSLATAPTLECTTAGAWTFGAAVAAGTNGVQHIIRTGDQGVNHTFTHGEIHFANGGSVSCVPMITSMTADDTVGLIIATRTGNGNTIGDMRFEIADGSGAAHATTTNKAFSWLSGPTEIGNVTRAGAWTFGAASAGNIYHRFNGVTQHSYNGSADGGIIISGLEVGSISRISALGANLNDTGLFEFYSCRSSNTLPLKILSSDSNGRWTIGLLNDTGAHTVNGTLNSTVALSSPIVKTDAIVVKIASGAFTFANSASADRGSYTDAGAWTFGPPVAAGTNGVQHVVRTGDQGDTATYTHGEIHFSNGSSSAALPMITSMTTDASVGLLLSTRTGDTNTNGDMRFAVESTVGGAHGLTTNNAFVWFGGAAVIASATRIGNWSNVAGGSWGTISDRRLKDNIVPLSGALDLLLKLKPCNYTWREDYPENIRPTTHFIADEVESVYPRWVSNSGRKEITVDGEPVILEDVLQVNLDASFNAYLVGAIQEQQAQIEELKALVATLLAR